MKRTSDTQSGKSSEWYTPPLYIAAARRVMGPIELDPASCEVANRTVQAERFITREQNGLMQPWVAKSVWLNPPYGKTPRGKSNLEAFTSYLLEQYRCGHTQQAICLVPTGSISTSWFVPLWDFPICFPGYRIRFLLEDGTQSDGPSLGTCLIYLGPHIDRFIEVFDQFGPIGGRISLPRVMVRNLALWSESVLVESRS